MPGRPFSGGRVPSGTGTLAQPPPEQGRTDPMTAPAVDLTDLVDMNALTAALADTTRPAPDPEPEPQETALEKAAPPVAQAIDAALNKLYPGDSKTAKERRKKIFEAICEELDDVVIWGVELNDRIPIGDPIILGNALIEVDAFGDAVTITTTERGYPVWDPK